MVLLSGRNSLESVESITDYHNLLPAPDQKSCHWGQTALLGSERESATDTSFAEAPHFVPWHVSIPVSIRMAVVCHAGCDSSNSVLDLPEGWTFVVTITTRIRGSEPVTQQARPIWRVNGHIQILGHSRFVGPSRIEMPMSLGSLGLGCSI